MVRVVGGIVTQVPWYDLFFRLDERRPILLTGGHRDGVVRQLRLNLLPQRAYPVPVEAATQAEPTEQNGKGGVAANVPSTTPLLEGIYYENGQELARHLVSGRRPKPATGPLTARYSHR